MREKDSSEKLLEDYDDVFADIMNVIIFRGERQVNPKDLKDLPTRSQYKADDFRLHEQERDIAKLWSEGNVELAICGVENQTKIETLMPARAMGYDGASYRSQLLKRRTKLTPVVTLVLYFGTDRKWKQPMSLKEVLYIPDGMEAYVNDYRIHVVNVAWLSEETIEKFQSDFRVVANFFAEKRKNANYVPNDTQVIKHVDEVLKLLSVMTGDDVYQEVLLSEDGKEVSTMCDVAERLVNKGRTEGRLEGRLEGQLEGENKLARLMRVLLSTGRTEDAQKAASDEEARKKFYREFGIID
ncbi:MAG: Rpn family recombination-promoting nuclease/putative transposase [Lachnospiraceae bacterium]|nr:Rpn family recombination-promoting nuclease/putative transposase [Lachnospiraceae bacterium]